MLTALVLLCSIGTTDFPDLDFTRKHEVAQIFADYLVREKTRLDVSNPLFPRRL